MSEATDKAFYKHFGKKLGNPEGLRTNDQREASLELNARQPRPAMEADGPADTKTSERTKGAAKAAQAMHGDSFSYSRVDPGPKTNSTSFGVKIEPPALPYRDDVVVDNGAAAPKSCLPPLEMRSPPAAGGLLPTGKTSRATHTTFNQPPLRLYSTEEANLWTSVPSAWYDSSFRRNKLLAAPSCRMVIQTKNQSEIGCLIQVVLKVVSAPARFWGRGARCFVVRLCVLERLVTMQRFWRIEDSGFKNLQEWYGRNIYAVSTAVNR